MTGPDRPCCLADAPHGDPALDPPLSIRVHPDDDPRDSQARRVVKCDGGPGAGFPWLLMTGQFREHRSACYSHDQVVTWPRQHWLVAATVFGHAVHADPRAGQPADQTAAELDGTDVAGTPFRMGAQ